MTGIDQYRSFSLQMRLDLEGFLRAALAGRMEHPISAFSCMDIDASLRNDHALSNARIHGHIADMTVADRGNDYTAPFPLNLRK